MKQRVIASIFDISVANGWMETDQDRADAVAYRQHNGWVREIDYGVGSEPEQADVSVDGKPFRWLLVGNIRTAAAQEDNGDGLVPFYRALLREIEAQALIRTPTVWSADDVEYFNRLAMYAEARRRAWHGAHPGSYGQLIP